MHQPGPTLRCVLPPGEYDKRYQQEPSDFASSQITCYVYIRLQVLSVIDTLMLITVVPIFCIPHLVEYTGWYSSYHDYGYQLALVHLLPFIFIIQTLTIWVTVLVGINRYIAVCMPYQVSKPYHYSIILLYLFS